MKKYSVVYADPPWDQKAGPTIEDIKIDFEKIVIKEDTDFSQKVSPREQRNRERFNKRR